MGELRYSSTILDLDTLDGGYWSVSRPGEPALGTPRMGGGGQIWSQHYGGTKFLSLSGIETRLLGLQPVALSLYRLSYPGSLPGRGGERFLPLGVGHPPTVAAIGYSFLWAKVARA
jgi:hypothetical protein